MTTTILFNFNWDYYNKLYETPKFQKAFDMIAYLNAHGITNNLMLNFMGPVPGWIGKKNDQPRKEDEYVEMLVSFLYYAKIRSIFSLGLCRQRMNLIGIMKGLN